MRDVTRAVDWSVSIVVPVYNGAGTIAGTIEHLLRQSLQPLEIIVVDDGSTDETAAILKGFGNKISVLSKTNGGPASARNAGIRASTGSLIAFTDSDCFPEQNWLQEIIKGFKFERVGGAGGQVRASSGGLIGEYIDFHGSMNPYRGTDGTVLALVTANACFRSDVLLQTSLFDERFPGPGGEDTELSIRVRGAGYELTFVETAVVAHRHKENLLSYCKSIAYHGEGQHVLESIWLHQQTLANRPRKLLGSAFGLLTMLKFYRSYRQHQDRLRSFLFAFLDHCQYVARIWGYRRGRHKLLHHFKRNPLPEHHGSVVYLGKEVVD